MAGHSSGRLADHRPLCRPVSWLLRWFEQNLEKVLPQPPKTSEVNGGKGQQEADHLGGLLGSQAVGPHPFPGGSLMGGVMEERLDSGEGWAGAQLAGEEGLGLALLRDLSPCL